MHATRLPAIETPRKRAAAKHLAIWEMWCRLGRPSIYKFARYTNIPESTAREAVAHHRSLEMLGES